MKPFSGKKRRDFLKTASLGAAGLLVTGVETNCSQEKSASSPASAWKPNKKINPAIDNLRVVCCHDETMTTGNPKTWDMQGQNAPVNAERVYKVLDEMAKSLTQKASPAEAWQTIFQKPAAKEWKDVRTAIKVNCIAENHPRVAVVAKVCMELNGLGVPCQNIIIYDSDDDAGRFYTKYIGKGLPKGVVVSSMSSALGGMVLTEIPKPYPGKFKCTKALADGTIDILVNCAVNKGHDQKLGKTTLTLKNHAGTFDPKPIHSGGSLDYIIAINKSNAILGGTPTRQQLCIVDSLWAMVKGPSGKPEKRLNRLVMGSFGPAVDYLTAKKVREPLMGAKHPNINRFLEDFGYSDSGKLDLITVKAPV